MNSPADPQQDQPSAEPTTFEWGKVFKRRIKNDLLAIPFFALWAFCIAIAIEHSPNDNFNRFFIDTLGEGVALKSMIVSLVLSLLCLALLVIVQPEPGSWAFRMFQAPWRTGRALCLSTGSIMLGVWPVLGYSEGWTEAKNYLVQVLVPVFGMWFALFMIDMLASDLKNLVEDHDRFWRFLGASFLICATLMICYSYHQIADGHFLSAQQRQEAAAQTQAPVAQPCD
ncbi:TPA: hypothetical protein ACKP22_004372 [Pseudomonas putida]